MTGGERLNKLLDSNLFSQEFVPKRHKFHDGRAKSDISLASQRKTLRNGGKDDQTG